MIAGKGVIVVMGLRKKGHKEEKNIRCNVINYYRDISITIVDRSQQRISLLASSILPRGNHRKVKQVAIGSSNPKI
jgi:hypothetical protein